MRLQVVSPGQVAANPFMAAGRPRPVQSPMRREATADHLGLAPETVSRVFARMRRGGLISSEYKGCLDLLDLDALHDLARGG